MDKMAKELVESFYKDLELKWVSAEYQGVGSNRMNVYTGMPHAGASEPPEKELAGERARLPCLPRHSRKQFADVRRAWPIFSPRTGFRFFCLTCPGRL